MTTHATTPTPDHVLTAADLAALRQALDLCRDERSAQLSALDLADDGPLDPVARAHAVTVRETLTAIDAALSRLDAGSYGTCRRCERPIPAERLRLVPYADECVGCRQLRLQGR